MVSLLRPLSSSSVAAILAIILWFGGAGRCSQDDNSVKADGSIFDESFYDTFNEMDSDDRVFDKLEEGFDNWEDRCLKIGGQSALDNWLRAQEDLIYCFLKNFDMGRIEKEVEIKKKTGDLDQVFKEYCGKPVSLVRPCVSDFLGVSRQCLRPKDRGGLNVTLDMVDAAIEFICHDGGDRLALFMSEDGLDCVREHKEPMMECINRTVPELFHMNDHKNIDLIVFNQENCRKGDLIRYCVERELLQCPDPTPSNVVNSMLLAMRRATPCQEFAAYSRVAGGAAQAASSRLFVALVVVMAWLRPL